MVTSNIAILLPTYNSELYLREQINSVLNQSFKQWILYIRDDGSVDNTVTIINEYCQLYGNIIFLKDSISNLGAKNSFNKLLSDVESRYYMFCDHDDVWLPEKISKTLSKIKEIESKYPQEPALVFTDLKVVDRNLNVICNSMWKFQKTIPIHANNIYNLSLSNPVTGCTVMINQAAKMVSTPIPSNALMHDIWIALNVSYYGHIDYVNEQTILYRQHNENVLGAKNVSMHYYFLRLRSINKLFSDNLELFRMLRSLRFKVNLCKLMFAKFKIAVVKFLT